MKASCLTANQDSLDAQARMLTSIITMRLSLTCDVPKYKVFAAAGLEPWYGTAY